MKVSVFIATSIDGFVARKDGGLDELPADGGEPHGYDEFMTTVDAVVIGRKTFETVMTYDVWPYRKKPVVVLSTRMREVKVPEVAVCDAMTGPASKVVAWLAERGVRHIHVESLCPHRPYVI